MQLISLASRLVSPFRPGEFWGNTCQKILTWVTLSMGILVTVFSVTSGLSCSGDLKKGVDDFILHVCANSGLSSGERYYYVHLMAICHIFASASIAMGNLAIESRPEDIVKDLRTWFIIQSMHLILLVAAGWLVNYAHGLMLLDFIQDVSLPSLPMVFTCSVGRDYIPIGEKRLVCVLPSQQCSTVAFFVTSLALLISVAVTLFASVDLVIRRVRRRRSGNYYPLFRA